VAIEPCAGQVRHTIESAGLLEEMTGTGHHRHLADTAEFRGRHPVEFEYLPVGAPDDQQGR
jgi:hypothetical protein